MIKVYLYGKLRKLSENHSLSGESTILLDYVKDETFDELLERLSIDKYQVGELFINHKLADFDTKIPYDNSRVGIFDYGMHLIDGGQHLKGHGFIKKMRKKGNYY